MVTRKTTSYWVWGVISQKRWCCKVSRYVYGRERRSVFRDQHSSRCGGRGQIRVEDMERFECQPIMAGQWPGPWLERLAMARCVRIDAFNLTMLKVPHRSAVGEYMVTFIRADASRLDKLRRTCRRSARESRTLTIISTWMDAKIRIFRRQSQKDSRFSMYQTGKSGPALGMLLYPPKFRTLYCWWSNKRYMNKPIGLCIRKHWHYFFF